MVSEEVLTLSECGVSLIILENELNNLNLQRIRLKSKEYDLNHEISENSKRLELIYDTIEKVKQSIAKDETGYSSRFDLRY
jgi:hypothetical protein